MLSNGLATSLPYGPAIGVTLCLGVILSLIAVIDIKTLRIPDVLSLPLIFGGLALAVAMPDAAAWDHVIGAGLAFALFAGLGEAYFRLRAVDGLGLGDAKLFAAAGAWLGWQNLPLVLLIATMGGLAQVLLRRSTTRDTALAFGPWIAFGFWAVWIWLAYGRVAM